MSEFGNGYKWSQAAVKGLLLALITVVCNTLSYLINSPALNILFFIVRTVASIWLLLSFMKQYTRTTGEPAMGFALCTVLFSSLICAFWDSACYAWFFPSLVEQVNEAMAQSMSMLPAESQSIMENMMDHYPRIALFSTFIKCFIEGIIVAAIGNSSTRSKDIFKEEGNAPKDELE